MTAVEPASPPTRARVSLRAVNRLLNPRSVAVVGASDDPRSIGGAPLALLDRFGYPGQVHLVSRSRSEVGGRRCLPSIAALPEGVDAAILAVPRAAVHDVLAELGGMGVGGAVVFSSGFAETGPEGAAQEAALREVALRHDIALAGPNCLGLVNFDGATPLTFGHIAPNERRSGATVAVVAQSGAMSLALSYALMAQGATVTHMVSTGNEAVLGVEDYLDAILSGPVPRAVVVLVEQVRRPEDFLVAARRARDAGTALCLMHTGLSERSRAASLSHTGALSGEQGPLRAVLAREAVLLVDSLDELVDTAVLLGAGRLPPSEAVGLMTDSGALKGFALDFSCSIGLSMPVLAGETVDALAGQLPAFATADNPVDITAMGINDPGLYARVASVLLDSDQVGTVVAATMPGSPAQNTQQVDALLPVLEAAGKPAVYVIMGGDWEVPEANRRRIVEAGVPLFRSLERALRAVRHVASYSAALTRPRNAPRPLPVDPLDVAPGSQMSEHQAKVLLSAAGIRVPRGRLATGIEQALRAADEIGYPVVLKASSPSLLHKSEVGGVLVAGSAAELAVAYDRIRSGVPRLAPGTVLDGILVEEQVCGGTEILVGARRQPGWGTCVVVGFGGALAEVVDDIAIVPGDACRSEIEVALKSLKCAPVLEGVRGGPRRDFRALVDAVETVAAILASSPTVEEVELNPLLVLEDGCGAVALDAVVRAFNPVSAVRR